MILFEHPHPSNGVGIPFDTLSRKRERGVVFERRARQQADEASRIRAPHPPGSGRGKKDDS